VRRQQKIRSKQKKEEDKKYKIKRKLATTEKGDDQTKGERSSQLKGVFRG